MKDGLDDLIACCKEGNPECQKQLYQQFYNYGMTICSRYARNREEAKELLNDGFYKVLTRLDKYNPELSFKGWINKIFVNTAIDHYRKTQHEPYNVDLEYAETYETDSEILAQISAAEVLELVQQLPPAYRMVFILYAVEGFKHHEIAEKLGITTGTSKSNLAKARAKLKTLIASTHQSKGRYAG